MVCVTQRPLFPTLKNKAKTFSSTSSADTLLGVKPGRDNFLQNYDLAINSKVYPKIVPKDWLLRNKPYACGQAQRARSSSLRAGSVFGFCSQA